MHSLSQRLQTIQDNRFIEPLTYFYNLDYFSIPQGERHEKMYQGSTLKLTNFHDLEVTKGLLLRKCQISKAGIIFTEWLIFRSYSVINEKYMMRFQTDDLLFKIGTWFRYQKDIRYSNFIWWRRILKQSVALDLIAILSQLWLIYIVIINKRIILNFSWYHLINYSFSFTDHYTGCPEISTSCGYRGWIKIISIMLIIRKKTCFLV